MPRNFSIGYGVAQATLTQADGPTRSFPNVPVGNLPELEVQQPPAPPQFEVQNTVVSAPSTEAYHSTLFRNFNLTAVPTYNFYEEGEDTAPTVDSSGTLASLPRYVTLRWRPAPGLRAPFGTKGTKPKAPKTPRPRLSVPLHVAATALANGYVSPGVVSALVVDPPALTADIPKVDEDSFLLDPQAAGRSAADLAGSPGDFTHFRRPTKPSATVVNFVDPSIAGALNENRISAATDDLHLTVAGSFAKILGALEVISEFNQDVQAQNPPPKFPNQPGEDGMAYVGYLIERYDLLPDGSMVLGRSVVVDDPDADEFIDQRVTYGGRYAYRIRSVIQWTRSSDVDFAGLSSVERSSELSALIGAPQSSFYAGDWTDWSRTQVVDTLLPEPPDEMTVQPVSWRGEIRISWKVPNNPQLDLSSFRLVRAEVTANGVSDWRPLGDFVVANGLYIDRAVVPFEQGNRSYIYSMYSLSLHGELSPLGDQVEAKLALPDAREEFPVALVVPAGADPAAHASGAPPRDSTEIKANRRLTFYCRGGQSGHPLRDSTYLVEVRSLSTGERAIVTLQADATDTGVADKAQTHK